MCGEWITLVDALTRNNIPHFLQVVQDAVQPTAIPQELVDLLVREQLDWTTSCWAQMFNVICRQV